MLALFDLLLEDQDLFFFRPLLFLDLSQLGLLAQDLFSQLVFLTLQLPDLQVGSNQLVTSWGCVLIREVVRTYSVDPFE